MMIASDENRTLEEEKAIKLRDTKRVGWADRECGTEEGEKCKDMLSE